MLKWVSRSSVLHDIEEEDEVVDDVKKAKEEILDSASKFYSYRETRVKYTPHHIIKQDSPSSEQNQARSNCSLADMDEIPLTPETSKNKSVLEKSSSFTQSSLVNSSHLDVPSSPPPSLDSGMGGSKTSLNSSRSQDLKTSLNNENETSPTDKFLSFNNFSFGGEMNNYSLLWGDHHGQVESGDKLRTCSVKTDQLRQFLSFTSLLITLPCLLQFPLATLQHGGLVFIMVYTIILMFLVYPSMYLLHNFSRFTTKNSVSVWYSLVPVSGGLGCALLGISIMLSARFSVDSGLGAVYTWHSLHNPLPWSRCSACAHHHSPPLMIKYLGGSSHLHNHTHDHQQELSVQFWRQLINTGQDEVNTVLLTSLVILWSVILLISVIVSINTVRRLHNCFILLVSCFTVSLLIRTMLEPGAVVSISHQLTPDWRHLTSPDTWVRAATLACISTNLFTGVIGNNNIGHPGAVSSDSLVILFSVVTHILVNIIFTVIILSMISQASSSVESVFIIFSRSLSSDSVWSQSSFCLITFLGLASLLSTLSTPLIFIRDRFRITCHRIPAIIGVIMTTFIISILSCFSFTNSFSSNLYVWGVEKSCLVVGGLVQVTVVWIYGLNTLLEKLSAWRGKTLNIMLVRFLQVFGFLAPLHLSTLGIFSLYNTGQSEGLVILVTLLAVIILIGLVILVTKIVVGRRKKMTLDQIMVREVLGRRQSGPQAKSLTNSYRKFERCDITLTNMKLSPTLRRGNSSGSLFRRSPRKH